jgi:hypothetical protein
LAVARLAVLGTVMAIVGGCAARSPFASQEDARIVIEIINHNFQDATVRAHWIGKSQRLGTVTGTRTANFMIPWERSVELRIEIDFLAGGNCMTRAIWADPGDTILLEIQSRINQLDCFE